MTGLQVAGVGAGYGGEPVVRDVSFGVEHGRLLAVVGASGSGKSTLLRAIAGFIPVSSGIIRIGDRLVTGPGVAIPPEHRSVGIVTQDGSLFPHLTVARNVGFGLPRRTLSDGTPTADRVRELLSMVGLSDVGSRFPHELSGGQQQRVALARALAPNPEAVLLDEPFSALDAGLRSELGHEVRQVLRDARTTAMLVTHDQDEALSLADHVALLVDGRIAQQGSPRDLYERPANLAVASFLGEVNVLPVLALEPDGDPRTALGVIPVSAPVSAATEVVVRPEQVVLTRVPAAPSLGGQPPAGNDTRGRVAAIVYFGHDSIVDVELADRVIVRARVLGDSGLAVGDEVRVSVCGHGQPL